MSLSSYARMADYETCDEHESVGYNLPVRASFPSYVSHEYLWVLLAAAVSPLSHCALGPASLAVGGVCYLSISKYAARHPNFGYNIFFYERMENLRDPLAPLEVDRDIVH